MFNEKFDATEASAKLSHAIFQATARQLNPLMHLGGHGPMLDTKFKVGQTYPLRGGGTGRIYDIIENYGSYSTTAILGSYTPVDSDSVYLCVWRLDGRHRRIDTDGKDDLDLMLPKCVGWLNVYPNNWVVCYHETREEADKHSAGRIACIRVEFSEEEGL